MGFSPCRHPDNRMKFIIFLACVAYVAANSIYNCPEPKNYIRIVKGARSKAEHYAEATANACPIGFQLIHCGCESYAGDPNGCDGSVVITDSTGETCTAYNSEFGKGVVAVGTCARAVYTCKSPKYVPTPRVKCPKNYRLISCSLHAYKYHTYEGTKIPYVIKDGGLCRATAGCEQCKITAKCLRNAAII